jgi:hypothetical protein
LLFDVFVVVPASLVALGMTSDMGSRATEGLVVSIAIPAVPFVLIATLLAVSWLSERAAIAAMCGAGAVSAAIYSYFRFFVHGW